MNVLMAIFHIPLRALLRLLRLSPSRRRRRNAEISRDGQVPGAVDKLAQPVVVALQTGGPPCETIRIGETDNSREKMQNVRGDRSAYSQMKISVTATIIAVELRGAENGTEDFKEIDSFSIPLGTDVRK